MYHVVRWNDKEVMHSNIEKLSTAKRLAKKMGYEENNDPMFTSHDPIAYVANDNMELVYNPRFKRKF